MTELLKTIRERKSVRTFDGRPVSAEDREKIEQYIRTIENPFGVPVRFVLLDAGTHGLSSPVLSREAAVRAAEISRAEVPAGKRFAADAPADELKEWAAGYC